MTVRDLHRLAGVHERLQQEAASGPCHLHPDQPSVGYIEGWDLHPKGCCQACADYGRAHGYTIHEGTAGREKVTDPKGTDA